MGDPGIGLDKVPHKVLNYNDLVALNQNDDLRTPSRQMEIHLTGNMERYMWSFDGEKFSAVSDEPIRFAYNERVRVKLVNNTMMAHPIHLHGHFFELVNGAPADRQPQKHTVIVQPGVATFAPITFRDLTPGRRVQVLFTGPVAESYPVQAPALQVVILE